MNKRVVILVALAIIVGFFAFNSYIYNQKQAGSDEVQSYTGTLTGEYVCLPHRDTKGPQTLECALGMKTDSNEYYALDFNLVSGEAQKLMTGDRFTATGTITPLEMLSSDHWQKYNIEGIFSVSAPIQK